MTPPSDSPVPSSLLRPPKTLVDRWRRLHGEWSAALRAITRAAETSGTDDPQAGLLRVDERLLRVVWHDQLLKADHLVAASGKRVEVIEPGRWNNARGPDFLSGRFRIAGEIVEGDVELHIDSRDWRGHGHHQDFEYNGVVLHVCLRAGDDRPYDEHQNAARLERLVLEPVLDPDLETLRRTINLDDYPYARPEDRGLCHTLFLQQPEDRVRAFFETAGRLRLEEKIARFAAQRVHASLPQLAYQSLMVSQGYKSSKTLYFLLSKRAPVAELLDHAGDLPPADRADQMLAILLNVAQLTGPPPTPDLLDPDEESRAFRDRLNELWRPTRAYFADRLIPPTKRWMAGIRPPAFPARRLAAVALLLARASKGEAPLIDRLCSQLRAAADSEFEGKPFKVLLDNLLLPLLVDEAAHYFARHYTLGGKEAKPMALLGEPAARTVLFNALLPLAVLRAREDRDTALERRAWLVLQRFPALPDNSVTDFMKQRLLADSPLEKALFRTELMQQGLYRVFGDCCAQNERTCADCTFLRPPFVPAMIDA